MLTVQWIDQKWLKQFVPLIMYNVEKNRCKYISIHAHQLRHFSDGLVAPTVKNPLTCMNFWGVSMFPFQKCNEICNHCVARYRKSQRTRGHCCLYCCVFEMKNIFTYMEIYMAFSCDPSIKHHTCSKKFQIWKFMLSVVDFKSCLWKYVFKEVPSNWFKPKNWPRGNR